MEPSGLGRATGPLPCLLSCEIRIMRVPLHGGTGRSNTMLHLAPRECQCSHELRPASNSSSCLPPGVGAPGKLGYHPRPPTLRQGGSDVCLRGEAGSATAGMPVPSPPACPQPQPCRAVVCTHPSGAAQERPGPRTGNGCSDGLDGAPRTQRRPQARRCARSPPRTGSPGLA